VQVICINRSSPMFWRHTCWCVSHAIRHLARLPSVAAATSGFRVLENIAYRAPGPLKMRCHQSSHPVEAPIPHGLARRRLPLLWRTAAQSTCLCSVEMNCVSFRLSAERWSGLPVKNKGGPSSFLAKLAIPLRMRKHSSRAQWRR
jgi:hypothetical protein